MRALTKLVLGLIVCIVFSVAVVDADDPPESAPLITIDLSGETIAFNEVTSDGTITTIGSLPNTFSVYPDESGEWLIPDPQVFYVAPDAPVVAFTARRGDEYRLYIFDILINDLREVTIPYWGLPKWSPDGKYIFFSARPFFVGEPIPIEVVQRYLYDVVNDQIFTLTENPTDLPPGPQWLPDSSGFAWTLGTGSNVEIADRQGRNQRILNDPPLDLSDVPNLPEFSCRLTWSPELERYFYAVGCQGFGDTTFMRIYSVNLLGNTELVVDFEQFFPAAFFRSYVANITPASDGIYISVQTNYLSLNINWYVLRIGLDGQTQIVADLTKNIDGQNNRSQLRNSQISPDGRHIALIGIIEQRIGGMQIVDLETGAMVSQVLQPEAEDQHVCEVRWVSDTEILFEWRDYFCYLTNAEIPGESALLNITTDTVTSLSNELGTENRILPVPDVKVDTLPVTLFPSMSEITPFR